MKSKIIISIFLLLCFPACVYASSSESEEFRADEYIMEHIADGYGWHITTFKGHEISIPLPIILIEKGKFYFFMSSKFHHGTNAFKGFALGFTEDTKGKIVKLQGEDANYTGILDKDKTYQWNRKFLDISITKNVCALFISIALICWIFLSVAKMYKRNPGRAPKGFQNMMETVILFIRDEVAIPLIGAHKYQKFFPYILTLFFFILINNLMGLLPIFPGGANLTGNIAVTLALALFTFLSFTIAANKNYWRHIFNMPGVPVGVRPLLALIEVVGLFTKPFVLMIRLFANIVAGHIVILSFMGLIFIFGAMVPMIGYMVSPVSILIYIFMGLIELLVAFIQAFIFTMLTALYIGMATEETH